MSTFIKEFYDDDDDEQFSSFCRLDRLMESCQDVTNLHTIDAYSLNVCVISYADWENLAKDRTRWHQTCDIGVLRFEVQRTAYLRQKRAQRKNRTVWKAVVDVPCNLQRVVIILQRVVDINQ